MPVRHQLLAPKGATLADIKTVESHVHALGQCRNIIRKLGIKAAGRRRYRGLRPRSRRGGDKTRAAWPRGSPPRSTASTSWPRTSKTKPTTPRASSCWRASRMGQDGDGPVITTFVFRVRNVPAALYKALGGFATNGVNMTKLESYMVDGNFFATQFYADVEGHPEDRSLVLALEELAFFSKEMKILGVYPGAPVPLEVRGNDRLTLGRSSRLALSSTPFRHHVAIPYRLWRICRRGRLRRAPLGIATRNQVFDLPSGRCPCRATSDSRDAAARERPGAVSARPETGAEATPDARRASHRSRATSVRAARRRARTPAT